MVSLVLVEEDLRPIEEWVALTSSASSSVSQIQFREGRLFNLSGIIDQTFDLSQFEGRQQGVVVFDLDGVSRITSFGVRVWINMLSRLQADYYCFINCHAAMLWQFNLVAGFAQAGELISLHIPYVCTSCNKTHEKRVDLRHEYKLIESTELPEIACPSCGGPSELDDLAEVIEYARRASRPRPPAAATSIIDGKARAAASACTVRKDVEDTVTAVWVAGLLDKSAFLTRVADGLEGELLLVLPQLEQITAAGVAGLKQVISAVPESWVARIPIALAEPMAELFSQLPEGAAKIVSWEGPFRCNHCERAITLELFERDLRLRDDGSHVVLPCPRCTHSLSPAFLPELFVIAARLPIGRPPDQVGFYLRNSRTFPVGRTDSSGPLVTERDPFSGKYRVIKLIGNGGMGEVFLARQIGPEAFERLVVLKRIRPNLDSKEVVQAFLQEARLAARLIHPNIVQVYELVRGQDEYFMAMEYVNGIDLNKLIAYSRAAQVTWPIGVCCRIVSDLCSALEAAHSYQDENGVAIPIIHRDVSPSNVLISLEGEVKLADFGVATALDSSTKSSVGTISTTKVGYSAPEFQQRGGPVGPRADIYSAGVVLYECLTLRRFPITGSSGPNRRVSLTANRNDVPPELEAVCQRAIARDPAARFGSARELQRELEAILQQSKYTARDDLATFIRAVIAARDAGEEGKQGNSKFAERNP